MTPKTKRSLIEYGIFIAVALGLYVTGLHTEVIGFVQRGILATGVMNPDVSDTSLETNDANGNSILVDYNFKLIDEQGHVKSFQDFKGKVIFFNLWATWCPPCLAELPNIATLHEDLKDDVVFVMLSVDEDFNTAIAFNHRKGYKLPIYALGSRLPQQFQTATTIPRTYVIDAKGHLVLTHKGMANYASKAFKAFLIQHK